MFGFGKRKNRVITLNLDRTYDERMRVCEGGMIKGYGKDNEKEFKPNAVFDPAKRAFFKKPKLIIVGEKCLNAYTFNPNTEGLETHWTKPEATEVVKKETALSLQKLKPIEWNIAIILMILIAVTIVCQIIIMNRLGII